MSQPIIKRPFSMVPHPVGNIVPMSLDHDPLGPVVMTPERVAAVDALFDTEAADSPQDDSNAQTTVPGAQEPESTESTTAPADLDEAVGDVDDHPTPAPSAVGEIVIPEENSGTAAGKA